MQNEIFFFLRTTKYIYTILYERESRECEGVWNDPYGSYVPGLVKNGPSKESQHKRHQLGLPTPLQREVLFFVRPNERRHFVILGVRVTRRGYCDGWDTGPSVDTGKHNGEYPELPSFVFTTSMTDDTTFIISSNKDWVFKVQKTIIGTLSLSN